MKKTTIMIIIVIIIAFLLSYSIWTGRFECSFWHPENCDYKCYSDADCKRSRCGACMNTKEACSTERRAGLLYGEIAQPFLAPATCKCIENKCETIIS